MEKQYLWEEIFAEFNFAYEQFSDKNFHFYLLTHFDPYFSPILTLFSEKEKNLISRIGP